MGAYHYIIVVHGMGESRYGETVLPVISRCADVVNDVLEIEKPTSKHIKASYEKEGRDIVTLGTFVGASPLKTSDQPWVEFEGLPSEIQAYKPFTGIATHDQQGKLLRFVDVWWKDLVDESEHVLEPASQWADGLIGRIERLDVDAPAWMPQLLFKLQDVLGPMQTILKSRVPDVEKLAFNKYLGDVQIYAEYEPMRGKAVRRFHDRMQFVYEKHLASLPGDQKEAAPEFTIIAHSLGSIMSLDALMYAHHADPSATASDASKPHFAGYNDGATSTPNTEWVKYVKTFVTLGSPIDKFLLFWPYKYQYLNNKSWIKPEFHGTPRIHHINYCDEQDPVGQSLDTLRSTEAYNCLFSASLDKEDAPEEIHGYGRTPVMRKVTKSIKAMMERAGRNAGGDTDNEFDVVYRRSVWPGLAHTSYWKDKDLFKNILEHVLRKKRTHDKQSLLQGKPNVVSDKRGMYIFITLLTYFIVPVVVVSLDSIVYDMFLEPESWKGYLAIGALFVCSCWISREVVNMLVWWRQLLRNKRSREVVAQSATSIFVKWVVRLGLPIIAIGFAQIAINVSSTYVTQIKQNVEEAQATLSDGTAAETSWPAFPEALAPFQLINGDTYNNLAFWVSLLGLLLLLTLYRMNVSNFKESARYEAYLSIPVDIIVVIIGYWLLLTMWHGPAGRDVIAGAIWQHPVGFVALGCLTFWHLYKVIADKVRKKKSPNMIQEIITSYIVLGLGWLLISSVTDWFIGWAPDYLSPDARKRFAYFSFISVIVWIYMAMRFYVAKAQLGFGRVPTFKAYFDGS